MAKIYDSQSREEAIKLCKPADESSNSQAVLLPPRQALAQAGVRFYTSSSYTSSTDICDTHHLHFENLCPALSSTCPRAGSPRQTLKDHDSSHSHLPKGTFSVVTSDGFVAANGNALTRQGTPSKSRCAELLFYASKADAYEESAYLVGKRVKAGGTSGGSPPRSLARSSEPSSSNQPSIP